MPIRFYGGPWDGHAILPASPPPMELRLFARQHGKGWMHVYMLLRRRDHWDAAYAGVYRRQTEKACKPKT